MPNNTIERFFDKHGRLPQLPVRPDTQRELAAYIASFFDGDRQYLESEVNDKLMPFSDEYIALRRMLVDFKVLQRDKYGASYWKNGE